MFVYVLVEWLVVVCYVVVVVDYVFDEWVDFEVFWNGCDVFV